MDVDTRVATSKRVQVSPRAASAPDLAPSGMTCAHATAPSDIRWHSSARTTGLTRWRAAAGCVLVGSGTNRIPARSPSGIRSHARTSAPRAGRTRCRTTSCRSHLSPRRGRVGQDQHASDQSRVATQIVSCAMTFANRVEPSRRETNLGIVRCRGSTSSACARRARRSPQVARSIMNAMIRKMMLMQTQAIRRHEAIDRRRPRQDQERRAAGTSCEPNTAFQKPGSLVHPTRSANLGRSAPKIAIIGDSPPSSAPGPTHTARPTWTRWSLRTLSTRNGRSARRVARSVVRCQQVLAPIVGEVAPYGVDVVGAVLRVVVFDQQARAMDRVVVAAARLDRGLPTRTLVSRPVRRRPPTRQSASATRSMARPR